MQHLWKTISSDHSGIYAATPLGDTTGKIRLLTLHPGNSGKKISCGLSVQDLSTAPRFEALSYAWGDPNADKHEIEVDGFPFKVLPNLFSALWKLRLATKPRLLWADAICIDQTSQKEKRKQVGFMRDIFAAAAQTIVWLGESDDDSRLIFRVCNELRQRSPSIVADDFCKAWDTRLGDTGILDFLGFGFSDQSDWTLSAMKDTSFQYLSMIEIVPALVNVLERSWFTRLWVLQEVAVSKDVLVQCGEDETHLLPLLFYAALLRTVAGHGFTMHQSIRGAADNCWHERVMSFLTLVAAKDPAHPNATALPLSIVVSCFRRFHSGLESDKLFALYGLAESDVEKLGIQPDYSVDADKAYINVSLLVMQQLKDLSVLECPRGAGKLRQGLPSWVPDWSDTSQFAVGLTPESQTDRTPLEQHTEQANARLDLLKLQAKERLDVQSPDDASNEFLREFRGKIQDMFFIQRFEASGKSSAREVTLNDNNILSLYGVPFDEIVEVSEVLESLEGPPKDYNSNDDFVEHCRNLFNTVHDIAAWHRHLVDKDRHFYSRWVHSRAQDLYFTGETLEEAYVQTLCAGSRPGMHSFANHWKSNQQLVESVRNWTEIWRGGEHTIDAFQWMGQQIFSDSVRRDVEVRWQKLLGLTQSRHIDGLAQAAAPTFHRRIALTKKGYFALVPKEAALHDQIVIFEGGKLPLVTRSCNDSEALELIGESYVHGIMFGEAWDETACKMIQLS